MLGLFASNITINTCKLSLFSLKGCINARKEMMGLDNDTIELYVSQQQANTKKTAYALCVCAFRAFDVVLFSIFSPNARRMQ